MKYLSAIDQVLQWNVITRERFLAVWIVLFALAGLYLLGFLRMEGIRSDETLGVGRMLAGAAFLIFAISLIPGMFGRRSANSTLTFRWRKRLRSGGVGQSRTRLDEERSRGRARPCEVGEQARLRRLHRLCLHQLPLDEGEHVHAPEVAEAMSKFVLVELYTDGTDAVSDTNQKLQERQFKTVAIPFYAVFDADQRRCRQVRRAYPQRSRLLRLSSYSMKTVLFDSARYAAAAARAGGYSRLFRGPGTGATRTRGESPCDSPTRTDARPTWSGCPPNRISPDRPPPRP